MNIFKKSVAFQFHLVYIQLASYNHGHNITKIFDVLPNFLFTTSETKPDC